MSELFVSFDELMAACNFKDKSEFQRVLRNRGLDVPRRKPIDRELADRVTEGLIGKKLDWYDVKQRHRDADGGPLECRSLLSPDEVRKYLKLLNISDYEPFLAKDALLGVVFFGGFLSESEETAFVLRLNPGINVLIGDRGSGKSTALALLGLLADSISEETGVLVNNLLTLLNPAEKDPSQFTRRIRRILFQYGIDEYSCFYTHEQRLHCFCVSLSKESYDFLSCQDNDWKSLPALNEITPHGIKPKMQVLRQGEVIQIADAQNNFYLNNMLDALFPELYQQREELVKGINRFREQHNNYRRENIPIQTEMIKSFIKKREAELGRLRAEIDQRFISARSIETIERYVRTYDSLKGLSRKSIVELLQMEDSDVLFYLYLSRIIALLSREARRMRALDRRRQQVRFVTVPSTTLRDTEIEPAEEAEDPDTSTEYQELLKEMDEDKQDLEADAAKLEEPQVSLEEIEYDPEERKLFLQYMEVEKTNPLYKQLNEELLAVAAQIADFLSTRLGILRTWWRFYDSGIPTCTDRLMALAQNYQQLLQNRYDLINMQEEKCRFLTKAVNKDDFEIDVYTKGMEDQEREVANASELFTNLAGRYLAVMRDNAHTPLKIWRSRTYKRSVDYLFDELETFRQQIKSDLQNDFVFTPIEIEMRQGSSYRTFRQLSFGQKSSIILNIVFHSSNKNVTIIDQPEDNLDAKSIVKVLARTLNRLAKERQVIIATHNSNLVLGLDTDNVIVLESLGDGGRIRLQGAPLGEGEIIEAMIEVLEGGLDSFELKIDTFNEFVSRVRGQIRDIDITMIESSFRRRTIDDLRNFLQPIVSDRAILDFVRHELKTGKPAMLQQEAIELSEYVKEHRPDSTHDTEILDRIDKLFLDLTSHVEQLKGTIEDIRLMDTEPKAGEIDISDLLLEVKDKMGLPILLNSGRRIRIEVAPRLSGVKVKFDEGHLKLIVRNLINNSLRATEQRAVTALSGMKDYQEEVAFSLEKISDNFLHLLVSDNGRGIPGNIRPMLYIERCSDQDGKDDGLGGVTIRKLMDLNGGNIQVLRTMPEFDGTLQRLILPLVGE